MIFLQSHVLGHSTNTTTLPINQCLISITLQRVISFISKGWDGRASDKFMVENSGYLIYLSDGNVVLADRGFDVTDSFALFGATYLRYTNIHYRGQNQLSGEEVEVTRKIVNVRIHVERIIGSACTAKVSNFFNYKRSMSHKTQKGNIILDSVCSSLLLP